MTDEATIATRLNEPDFDLEMLPTVGLTSSRYGPLFYPRADRLVGRAVRFHGELCPLEVIVMRNVLRPGATAVEVGANIGVFTVVMGRAVGPAGRVIAFEPQRRLFNLLCANLMMNELAQVEALPFAVARDCGALDFPQVDLGKAINFGSVGRSTVGTPSSRVQQRTIDSLGLDGLDFLKVDVEGAEADVLAGAAETIGRLRPVIVAEADRPDASAGWLADLLDRDYRCRLMIPKMVVDRRWKPRPTEDLHEIINANILAFPGTPPVWADNPRLWLRPVPSVEAYRDMMAALRGAYA